MRRGSLVAPLLLIAIGGLLLARNLYPDLRLMDWVAAYWPYVLVAWGGLRLLEIFWWAARSRPLPMRGFTGGEFLLALFIIFLGSSVHAVRDWTGGFSRGWPGTISLGGVEIFGQRFDYPVSLEKATSKTPRVVLEDFRGDVQVTGANTDLVKVSGQMTVRAIDRPAADRVHQETPLELTGDSNRVVLRMRRDQFGPAQASAAIEINVPKGASVEIEGRSGDLRVVSVDGSVELKGRGSDIDLQDIGGQVAINGVFNGVIQAQRLSKTLQVELPRTQLTVEQIPGELRMALGDVHATNVVGPVRLNTRSHDVRIEDFTNSVNLSVERGDLDLRPGRVPLSKIEAHARSGDIRLSLPDGAQFSMNASTVNGDISSDFDGQLKRESIGRHSSLKGNVGNGPAIELETERGNIQIRKGGSSLTPQTAVVPTQRPHDVERTIEKTIEQKIERHFEDLHLEQLKKLDQ